MKEDLGARFWYKLSTVRNESQYTVEQYQPSGNKPLFPFVKCLPKYHPSPKSSSRSINSTRSPFVKLNSSELRAEKSSAFDNCQPNFCLRVFDRNVPSHSMVCFQTQRIQPGNNFHLRITIKICPGSGLPLGSVDSREVILLQCRLLTFRQRPG